MGSAFSPDDPSPFFTSPVSPSGSSPFASARSSTSEPPFSPASSVATRLSAEYISAPTSPLSGGFSASTTSSGGARRHPYAHPHPHPHPPQAYHNREYGHRPNAPPAPSPSLSLVSNMTSGSLSTIDTDELFHPAAKPAERSQGWSAPYRPLPLPGQPPSPQGQSAHPYAATAPLPPSSLPTPPARARSTHPPIALHRHAQEDYVDPRDRDRSGRSSTAPSSRESSRDRGSGRKDRDRSRDRSDSDADRGRKSSMDSLRDWVRGGGSSSTPVGSRSAKNLSDIRQPGQTHQRRRTKSFEGLANAVGLATLGLLGRKTSVGSGVSTTSSRDPREDKGRRPSMDGGRSRRGSDAQEQRGASGWLKKRRSSITPTATPTLTSMLPPVATTSRPGTAKASPPLSSSPPTPTASHPYAMKSPTSPGSSVSQYSATSPSVMLSPPNAPFAVPAAARSNPSLHQPVEAIAGPPSPHAISRDSVMIPQGRHPIHRPSTAPAHKSTFGFSASSQSTPTPSEVSVSSSAFSDRRRPLPQPARQSPNRLEISTGPERPATRPSPLPAELMQDYEFPPVPAAPSTDEPVPRRSLGSWHRTPSDEGQPRAERTSLFLSQRRALPAPPQPMPAVGGPRKLARKDRSRSRSRGDLGFDPPSVESSPGPQRMAIPSTTPPSSSRPERTTFAGPSSSPPLSASTVSGFSGVSGGGSTVSYSGSSTVSSNSRMSNTSSSSSASYSGGRLAHARWEEDQARWEAEAGAITPIRLGTDGQELKSVFEDDTLPRSGPARNTLLAALAGAGIRA